MDIISTIVLAIGLSMDSMVIALTSGAIIKNHKPLNVLRIAGMLALMQASLAVAGWFLGSTVVDYINLYDHWFAFAILSFLGGKMIYDGIRHWHTEEGKRTFNPLSFKTMFSLALATSIDAMAVGLSLSIVNYPITRPAVVIGVVTLILSSIGVVAGSKVGGRYNHKINVIGGVILILIGLLILAEHTLFASDEMLTLL